MSWETNVPGGAQAQRQESQDNDVIQISHSELQSKAPHKKQCSYAHIHGFVLQFVDYLCNQSLVLEVWGQQKEQAGTSGDKKDKRVRDLSPRNVRGRKSK